MNDLLHRVRWANLARAAAVLAALALVFAWPHLHASAEPSLPPAAAAPLDTTPTEELATTTVPAPAAPKDRPRRAARVSAPRKKRARRRVHRHRAPPRPARAPVAPPTVPQPAPSPPPAYVPPSPPPQPAGAEFRP